MNQYEKKALNILRELVQCWKIISVKGELEDEGLSLYDLIRLRDIASNANTQLTVKIGGCGAVFDLITALNVGANSIVSPMIETPYALTKFVSMLDGYINERDLSQMKFYINLETLMGYKNIDSILRHGQLEKINGIVIGRVDLIKSMNLSRNSINSEKIFDVSLELCEKVSKTCLTCGIGGGISLESINCLKNYPPNLVDFFETRKVAFDFEMIHNRNIEKGLMLAVEFEYQLLRAKVENYSINTLEDFKRIKIIEKRMKELSFNK